MRFSARTLAPLLLAPLLTQCGPGTAPQSNAVTGPFDSRGNYVEEWADQPDKWYRPPAPSDKPKPKPQIARNDKPPTRNLPEIAVVQPRPEVVQPKPKPVVVKPKPKPKPTVVKYTVRKGDNLSRIAVKYRTSVSALRRANGISGDLIRIGQVLKIPR